MKHENKSKLAGCGEQDGSAASPAPSHQTCQAPLSAHTLDKQDPSTSIKPATAIQQEKLFPAERPKQPPAAASHEQEAAANGGEEEADKQAKLWVEQLDQHLLGTKNSHLASHTSTPSAGSTLVSGASASPMMPKNAKGHSC